MHIKILVPWQHTCHHLMCEIEWLLWQHNWYQWLYHIYMVRMLTMTTYLPLVDYSYHIICFMPRMWYFGNTPVIYYYFFNENGYYNNLRATSSQIISVVWKEWTPVHGGPSMIMAQYFTIWTGQVKITWVRKNKHTV